MKPATEQPPRSRPRPPDSAALDELRKAFGVEPDEVEAAEDDEATGAATAPTPREPLELEIVEQTPVVAESDPQAASVEPAAAVAPVEPVARVAPVAPVEPVETPPAPRIIKIDDYGGTGAPESSGSTPASKATPLIPGQPPTPAAPVERQVISIDSDDLPDAVYVEGSLDGGGSSSIVFIEDDVAADALTPESDRDLRRGIEPRMRERRLAVKRAQGRKRLKWVIAAFVLVLVGVAALATFGSSLFAIRADQVTITGNVYTDEARLQAVVDDLVGTPVLVADTQKAERELEQIPWVEDAKVTVHFPHGASIEISERQAVATYQGPDGKFRVLDREGRVLDVVSEGYPFAYVLITGPDPVDLDPAEVAPQGYQAAAELARNLTSTVRGHVERLEVTANGSRLVMWLDDGSEVYFGEARDLFAKLVRLETVLTQNPDREPGPIDISTSQATL